ncbi:hypothetical protein D3C72_1012100 [compost metagenome]
MHDRQALRCHLAGRNLNGAGFARNAHAAFFEQLLRLGCLHDHFEGAFYTAAKAMAGADLDGDDFRHQGGQRVGVLVDCFLDMGGAGQRPAELAQAVVVEVVPLALLGFLVELLVRRQVHQAHTIEHVFGNAGGYIRGKDADGVGNHDGAFFAFFLQGGNGAVHVGLADSGGHVLVSDQVHHRHLG